MLKLQFKNNAHPEVAVNEMRLTIGRDKANQVALEQAGISGFHAEIHNEDGKLLLVDLGSTNGTLVNGTRIQGRREIKLWDTIQIDTVEFEIVDCVFHAIVTGDFAKA